MTEVLAAPHPPGFLAYLGCVSADGEHGAVITQHDGNRSLALVFRQPQMVCGRITAVGAFASRGEVEEGEG
jgi:hypothetical protein